MTCIPLLSCQLNWRQRNLPNKRHLGKQAPYCTVQFNGETRRTKVIKRGGQHPEWDEEIRFTIFEEESTPMEDGAPPPPPPKDGRPQKVKGGSFMNLSCFADDPREPDLIGDTKVDLTEVLTTGETDGAHLI
jgi:neural Wiskott-Aldrich syndrome protein